jgi:Cd2+/Zn2+-exporting ATPase
LYSDQSLERGPIEKGPSWLYLAVIFAATILLSTALNWLFEGIPLGFTIPLLYRPATVSTLLYYIAIFGGGIYVGYIGLKELLWERRFSVEFLMAIAAVGAALINYLLEGAIVLFFYSLAEHFEDHIEDRARRTVEALSGYIPDTASRLKDGIEREVNIKEVLPGEIILVKPGERIPLDGRVASGISYVDQSILTGESKPAMKRTGDDVFAGSQNSSSVLQIRVTKIAEETLVSRIVKLVIQSRRRKANVERFVDRFAKIYVPIVIVMAALVALLFPIFLNGNPTTWIYRALILLVVSCPSAFIVSVPATIFTSTTAAARGGVIIKGGVYLEKLQKVKAVVFDKTGTLTLGRLEVTDIELRDKTTSILNYAAALERYSTHPVAEAIVRQAVNKGVDVSTTKVEGLVEMPGKGVEGFVNGVKIAIGNTELMKEKLSEMEPDFDTLARCDLHSRICISVDGVFTGTICLEDKTRDDAAEAIKQLKAKGIHTVMLTGDTEETAKRIAQQLQPDEYKAEVLPEEKLKIVGELRSRYGLVAMVGDGINDAPALAASDVGIAMGGSGVDVALESADVVLVKDELVRIPYLLGLGNLTMEVAKQNTAISLATKVALGILGLLGIAPLWFAVVAGDDGVTLLTLLNILRLTRLKK